MASINQVTFSLAKGEKEKSEHPRKPDGTFADVGKIAGISDQEIRKNIAAEKFSLFFDNQSGSEPRFAVAWLTPEDQTLFGCKGDEAWFLSLVTDVTHHS